MAWTLTQSNTAATTNASPAAPAYGAGTTAGNLLILVINIAGGVTQPTPPAGWSLVGSATQSSPNTSSAWIFANFNNAGGITTVSTTFTGTTAHTQLYEFTCPGVAQVGAIDASGTIGAATIAATLAIATSGNLAQNHELAFSSYIARYSAATAATLTAGSGFTQGGQLNNGTSVAPHSTFDYDLDTGGSSAGATLTDTVANNSSGAGSNAGAIVTFAQPVPAPVPPYIGGQVWRRQQRHRQIPLLAPQPNPYPIMSVRASQAALTLQTSTGPGDAVIFAATTAAAVTSVVDSQGNSYLQAQNDLTNDVSVWVATYNGTPGTPTRPLVAGTDTITATGSATGAFLIAGLRGAAPYQFDSNPAEVTGTSATPSGPTTATLQNANECVLAFYFYGVNQHVSAWGGGFFAVQDAHNVASISLGAMFPTVAGTGTAPQTPSATLSASSTWEGFTLSLFLQPLTLPIIPPTSPRFTYGNARLQPGWTARRPTQKPPPVVTAVVSLEASQVRERVQPSALRPVRRVQQPIPAPQGQPLPIYAKPAVRSSHVLMWFDWRPKRTQQRTTLQVSGPSPLPQVGHRAQWNTLRWTSRRPWQPPLRVSGPPPALTQVGRRALWHGLRFRPKYQWQPPLQVSGPPPGLTQTGHRAQWNSLRWTPKRAWQPPLQVSGPPPAITRVGTRQVPSGLRLRSRVQTPLPPARVLAAFSRARPAWVRLSRVRGMPFAAQGPAPAVVPPVALPRKAAWFGLRPKRAQQSGSLGGAPPPVVVIQAGLARKAAWTFWRHKRTQQANIFGAPPGIVPVPPGARRARIPMPAPVSRRPQAMPVVVIPPKPGPAHRIVWTDLRRRRPVAWQPPLQVSGPPPANSALPRKATWFERRYKRTQQFAPPALIAPFAGLARKVAWFSLRPKRTQQFAPVVIPAKLPPAGLPRRALWFGLRPKRTQQSSLLGGLVPPPTFNKAESTSTVTDPREGLSRVLEADLSVAFATDLHEGAKLAAADVNEGRSSVTDPRDGKASVLS